MTKNRNAFTLTELLIVMGIIIIVAVIAVPSFRALTGGRSTEAAQNQLSSFLQRARQEAIGVQEIRGVAFILNQDSGRPTAVMVREIAAPTVPAGQTLPAAFAPVEVYLDAVPDRDMLPLPSGVGIQMVDDAKVDLGTLAQNPADDKRLDDGYIGMNTATANGSTFFYCGAILFDSFGRVVMKQYAFKCFRQVPGPTPGTTVRLPSELANIWKMTIPTGDSFASSTDFKPGRTTFVAGVQQSPWVSSGFGFALYDQDGFANLGYTDADDQMVNPASYVDDPVNDTARSDEAKEERWLDANAVPILVNRNNGTLIKGQ